MKDRLKVNVAAIEDGKPSSDGEHRLAHYEGRFRMRPRADQPVPIKRTIRRGQLHAIVPLGDTTIYEMEQRGEFPRRFALSPRCVVWDLSEVEDWLEARRKGPIAKTNPPDVRLRRARPVRASQSERKLTSLEN